ncbi:MMPL family transporter [Bacillus aerolatus]|uniref:MMPL family transporter n=1 Tax=Bacillus aerolatus TaxID=2653354 RepID=A0A6I1FG73_9BACI|nr:MMPL family transporter [Bacillus aerolatus]KAB7704701.1 MMPL family transporter [Bacillus aerolatus]
MLRLAKKITAFSSSKKGAKGIVAFWIIAAVLLGGLAPSAKEYATSINESGLPDEAKSVIAGEKLQQYFPADEGVPALLVFYKEEAFTKNEYKMVDEISEKIAREKLPSVREVVPFLHMPPEAKASFISENNKTMILPVSLKSQLERKEINETVKELEKLANGELTKTDSVKLAITGPAGIAADMTTIFASADVVLLLATIGLIFVLLIVIYRSPLLALVPLLGAGIVYEVVNKTIGMFGSFGMAIESQSVSIMSILLFAALTDYSLFIVSRFKEELKKEENKYVAMKRCMEEVTEPILYSGSTVIAAMLVLFLAFYEPYRNFAPVFSLALVLILAGGLTLLPALYVLFGRKAFWPSMPNVESHHSDKQTIWTKIADTVLRRPVRSGLVVSIPLMVLALNTWNIEYSFNLIKSFPEDTQSRQGYEKLEENFSPGELAATTMIVESEEKLAVGAMKALRKELLLFDGVAEVSPDFSASASPHSPLEEWITEDGKQAKIDIVFSGNPYDQETFDQLQQIESQEDELKKAANLENTHFYFAGETAQNAEIRDVNEWDTMVIVVITVLVITALLALQTKSLAAPIYMMATIMLSYLTALGSGYFIFNQFFGYDEISYRIPLYTFIFLAALGVDYNIMLISRIKEEAKKHPIHQAIRLSLAKTGGVISSAGLILAATFAVLITQPLMELFMFGFTVAIGILIDTFLIRTILVPAIMAKLGKYSLWPQELKE